MTLEELNKYYADSSEEEEEDEYDDSSDPDWIMAANLLDDCAGLLSFLGDMENKKTVSKKDRKKIKIPQRQTRCHRIDDRNHHNQ